MSLTDKVALVTGGAQGLGKAFGKMMLGHGAKVALVDVSVEQGQATLSELVGQFGENNVIFLVGDVTNQKQMADVYTATKDKFKGLDIVINNAGVGGETADKWEQTVDINVKGTIGGTLIALDHLRKDKGGRGGVIVNISSMAAINPSPCGPVYAATKSAIMQFSLCWASNPEVTSNGVRINVLAPAFADTQMTKDVYQTSYRPDIAAKIVERAGVMTPECVAEALFELVDDHNKNGAVLKVFQTAGKSYHTA